MEAKRGEPARRDREKSESPPAHPQQRAKSREKSEAGRWLVRARNSARSRIPAYAFQTRARLFSSEGMPRNKERYIATAPAAPPELEE